MAYHPGEVNFRLADAFIVNKVDSAAKEDLEAVLANAALVNPRAQVVLADSALKANRPDLIEGRRVVIVGDGPTLTHGGMSFGAGTLAARRWGAREVLEGGKYAVGSIREAYETNPHLKDEVPAMGYSPQQVRDLEATLNGAGADVIIDSTPVDLSRLLDVRAPIVQVEYELEERGDALSRLLTAFEDAHFG